MIMVNKDYHKIKWMFYGSQCTQSMLTTVNVGDLMYWVWSDDYDDDDDCSDV